MIQEVLTVRHHSRRSEIPALPESVPYPTTSLPHHCPTRLSSNSFSHNLLSDPHPLNPVVPILYKNRGEEGGSQVFQSKLPTTSGAEIPTWSGRSYVQMRSLHPEWVYGTFGRPDADVPSPLESALENRARIAHLNTFRMNTYKSVSKQRTLSTFRMNTYEKQGRGWPVIVN